MKGSLVLLEQGDWSLELLVNFIFDPAFDFGRQVLIVTDKLEFGECLCALHTTLQFFFRG